MTDNDKVSFRLIGNIGVDSASIVIADPDYVMDYAKQHDDAKTDFFEPMFPELTRLLRGMKTGTMPQADKPMSAFPQPQPLTEPMGETMGLHIKAPWGDGVYPVYAELDQWGRCRKVLIDLAPDGEDLDITQETSE